MNKIEGFTAEYNESIKGSRATIKDIAEGLNTKEEIKHGWATPSADKMESYRNPNENDRSINLADNKTPLQTFLDPIKNIYNTAKDLFK